MNAVNHRVERVLGFFSCRPNWDPPTPHLQASPLFWFWWGTQSLAREGVRARSQFRRGYCTLWYSRYICTLWCKPTPAMKVALSTLSLTGWAAAESLAERALHSYSPLSAGPADRSLMSRWPGPSSDRRQSSWARIFILLWSPRIDSKGPIPPGCVAWRAGTTTLFLPGSLPPKTV
jgi:hypothetical protein